MGVEDWVRARFKPWQAVVASVVLGGAILLSVGYFAEDDHAEQARECRDLVSAELRAPASADFGASSVSTSGDRVRIVGEVDAENGFGANVRSEYVCAFPKGSSAVALVSLESR